MANKDVNIRPVALFLIIVGAFIAAFGIVGWLLNTYLNFQFSVPSAKMMGGFVILALGYIILELEAIRKDN